MDKYCTNCGKKLNLDIEYCLCCGKRMPKKVYLSNKKKNSVKVLEIISLISGTIAFYITLMLSLLSFDVLFEINNILSGIEEYLIFYKLFFAFLYSLLGFIPSIIGLITSVLSLKKEKSVVSLIGLVSSLISIVFCIEIIVYIIK